MKVRHGFVSNSSSSSFVIALPKGTQLSIGPVAAALFPKDPELKGGFSCYGDGGVSAAYAAEIVMRDLREAGPAVLGPEVTGEEKDWSKKTLREALGGYYYDDSVPEFLKPLIAERPDYDTVCGDYRVKLTDEERRDRWAKYDELSTAWYEKVEKAIVEHFNDHDIYVLEYSDNDGNVMSTMEHGGVFDQLIDAGCAMRISHH